MRQPFCYTLPYQADSAALFAHFATQPWAMWLDSGTATDSNNYIDIIVANPLVRLVTTGSTTTISNHNGTTTTASGNPFNILQQQLQHYQKQSVLAAEITTFCGGAVGYWGYATGTSLINSEIADMAVGIYGWAIVVNHAKQQTQLCVGIPKAYSDTEISTLLQRLQHPAPQTDTAVAVTSEVTAAMSYQQYSSAFERIQHYLREGDCYQVNLTQQYVCEISGSSWHCYQQLRQRQPAPFSAYLQYSDYSVLSFSPERFIQVNNGIAITSPIKGTRRRGNSAEEDRHLQLELLQSAKDRAENVMIVDLLRNDFGRHCQIGSVKVTELCNLQSHANVHHLVSTIHGKLATQDSVCQLLRDAFPGGSVTGAPKIRAMEIINELEATPRNIYCGSIGYIGLNGNCDTSIAIRTGYIHNNRLMFHAGGGIIVDSDCAEEYAEMQQKASFFFQFCHDYRS